MCGGGKRRYDGDSEHEEILGTHSALSVMLPPWQRKSSLCSQHPSQGEASTEVPRLRVGQLRIKGTVYINETTIFLDALFRLSDMRGRASLAVFSSCAAVGRRGGA